MSTVDPFSPDFDDYPYDGEPGDWPLLDVVDADLDVGFDPVPTVTLAQRKDTESWQEPAVSE